MAELKMGLINILGLMLLIRHMTFHTHTHGVGETRFCRPKKLSSNQFVGITSTKHEHTKYLEVQSN